MAAPDVRCDGRNLSCIRNTGDEIADVDSDDYDDDDDGYDVDETRHDATRGRIDQRRGKHSVGHAAN